jgi:hypothetical protein
MIEILNLNNVWILDKVNDKQQQNDEIQQTNASLRRNARHWYWIVVFGDRHHLPITLQVIPSSLSSKDNTPSLLLECSEVYCLPYLGPKDENPSSAAVTGGNSITLAPPHYENSEIGTKLLFEDEHVKIWEFRILSHESCCYHRHTLPYCFLNLIASTTQELDSNKQPVPSTIPTKQKDGQCTFVSYNRLSAHAVRNVGESIFLQFIIEFRADIMKTIE